MTDEELTAIGIHFATIDIFNRGGSHDANLGLLLCEEAINQRAENKLLRAAIVDFGKELAAIRDVDETWQWAMNEMSDPVNDRFCAAIEKLQTALDATDECPDCAARGSETDSLCFLHRPTVDAAGGTSEHS